MIKKLYLFPFTTDVGPRHASRFVEEYRSAINSAPTDFYHTSSWQLMRENSRLTRGDFYIVSTRKSIELSSDISYLSRGEIKYD